VKGILILFFLSIFIFHFSTVSAQPRLKRPEFWIGAHGGVTGSTILFQPAESGMSPFLDGCVLGGNGGLVFRYAGHKYCHFLMELNYTHRGWKQSGTAYNLHYIELPILMHLNFGSETSRWIFNLGPQIGYCLYDESAIIDKPFYWGLTAGTGVEFHSRHAGVYVLEARFAFALGGIYGTSVTDSHSMANPMDLSVTLGWMMPVRQRRKLMIDN
jgi:hypothetical protein